MDLQKRMEAVGKDLAEAYKRITDLRSQLSQADSVRASNKYLEDAIHQIPDLGEDEDYQVAVQRVVRERERLRDEVKSYKQSIEAEFEGAVELRQKHGARSNETFSMFVDRLAGDREIYADEVRCLRNRLEGMAEKLGVSIDGVVGAVGGAINERNNMKQECDYLRQANVAFMKQSDGRRRALLELEAERRKDWQRAEMLAAHESVPGVVRDQLSEVIGSLMHVYVGNPEIKGLPEIVDDLRRVRDRLANTSSQEGGS
jgi:hypothetical protein